MGESIIILLHGGETKTRNFKLAIVSIQFTLNHNPAHSIFRKLLKVALIAVDQSGTLGTCTRKWFWFCSPPHKFQSVKLT